MIILISREDSIKIILEVSSQMVVASIYAYSLMPLLKISLSNQMMETLSYLIRKKLEN